MFKDTIDDSWINDIMNVEKSPNSYPSQRSNTSFIAYEPPKKVNNNHSNVKSTEYDYETYAYSLSQKIIEHERTINLLTQKNKEQQNLIASLKANLNSAHLEKRDLNAERSSMLKNSEIVQNNTNKILKDLDTATKTNIYLNSQIIGLNDAIIEYRNTELNLSSRNKELLSHTEGLLKDAESQKEELQNVKFQKDELQKEIERLRISVNGKPHKTLMSKNVTDQITKDGDDDVYSWSEAVESEHGKCIDVYGFTAEQLTKISKYVCSSNKKKKNRKKVYTPTKDMFLIFVYFFARYPTVKVISEKFVASKTVVHNRIVDITETYAQSLFKKSTKNRSDFNDSDNSEGEMSYASYFFETNRSKDDSTALTYYSEDLEKYGVYAHCLHDSQTGRVLEFYLETGSREVCEEKNVFKTTPEEWADMYEENDEVRQSYKKRMEGKFLISTCKYRGDLSVFASVIRCILALVNFDILFENNV